MAKLKTEQAVLYVDLEKCEPDDPCAYDNTCRIHKLRWFLRQSNLISDDQDRAETAPLPEPGAAPLDDTAPRHSQGRESTEG